MGKNDGTDMGGTGGGFPPTHWSQILRLKTGDGEERHRISGTIIEQYWKPVYIYLRKKGFDNDRAKDLTQGFWTDIVLGRGLAERADPEKGRFRTLLLTALDRYVSNVIRGESAKKRRPAGRFVSLEGLDDFSPSDPSGDGDPAEAFNRAWAAQLIGRVLEQLERECRAADMVPHWELFRERVLGPIFENTTPRPMAELCRAYADMTPSQASARVETARRKYRAIMERDIRDLVGSDADVPGEIDELMEILSKNSAGLA